MYSPGIWELMVILALVLIIFGPGKLPQVGKSLGGAISEFKKSVAKKDDETTAESAASSDNGE